jgi:hypothetical protein
VAGTPSSAGRKPRRRSGWISLKAEAGPGVNILLDRWDMGLLVRHMCVTRATNLPCAYTDFATCPPPPAENRLPVAVEAGEKIPYERAAPAV